MSDLEHKLNNKFLGVTISSIKYAKNTYTGVVVYTYTNILHKNYTSSSTTRILQKQRNIISYSRKILQSVQHF